MIHEGRATNFAGGGGPFRRQLQLPYLFVVRENTKRTFVWSSSLTTIMSAAMRCCLPRLPSRTVQHPEGELEGLTMYARGGQTGSG